VITSLNELAHKHPLHEEIHRLLMSAYAGSGDRLAAGNQYQILVRRLKKELELAPEPQTRELYYKLCGTE
jgi:DNA-binding SARP family transcriptional activator